jgi:hypothetical protein
MIYRWREGARYRAKAQVVGERIEAIRETLGGELTPTDVVADATDTTSPLHPLFEWDNAKAAENYRIDQARDIIGSVMVVYAEDVTGAPTEPVRAFASVPSAAGTPVYTGTLDALRSERNGPLVLAQAKRELDGWRRRYRSYQALAKAVQAVEGVLTTAFPEQ